MMKSRVASVEMILLIALPLSLPPAQAQPGMNPDTYYHAPSSIYGKIVVLPPGTTFEGRIDSSVGSKISRAGERFTITLATPVLANGTDVIIPAGSAVTGEVVEAIPSSQVPHDRGTPRPNGKLRIQLKSLQTPEGITYPLVASISGETIVAGGQSISNSQPGGNIGYVGSAASFEAVAPGRSAGYRGRYGLAPQMVTRQELRRDAIYGQGDIYQAFSYGHSAVRSLVKRDHDLYIDSGSPITIKLDAPFKIGIQALNPVNITDKESFTDKGKKDSPKKVEDNF